MAAIPLTPLQYAVRYPSSLSMEHMLRQMSSGGCDYVPYLPLLEAQGFTAQRMRAMVRWDRGHLAIVLRALERRSVQRFGHPAMPRDVLERFIADFDRIDCSGPLAVQLPTSSPLLEPDVTLRAFLGNVMGFNLSARRALFLRSSFTVQRMIRMLSWTTKQIHEAVQLRLLDRRYLRASKRGRSKVVGRGLSTLEMHALELSILGAMQEAEVAEEDWP
ncbi:hypothetical protein MSAN_02293900 [Mycena sanguinolenta]|uniref:Uncharacterized protein n=1 Tax=Mycena sanguinolenta TaxID=230812 RepID=A0A8H6X8V8_9AGAR|nr:hypothetical protein MSAN_02293900 [Mycena sanguinolenta]